MRLGRSAKQCVWLGPDRHRSRCRDAVTNTDAESYAITNSYSFRMRTDSVANTYGNSYSDSYGNSNCDSDSYANSDGHSHGYTYGNGYTDCEASSNPEVSSYAASSPVARKVTGWLASSD